MSDKVVSDKGRFRKISFQTKGRFRQRSFQTKVVSGKGRFTYRVVSDTGSFQTQVSDEEIRNQNSGPEGQNFDSKSQAPHNYVDRCPRN